MATSSASRQMQEGLSEKANANGVFRRTRRASALGNQPTRRPSETIAHAYKVLNSAVARIHGNDCYIYVLLGSLTAFAWL
mmetsp:Transcript_19478/g.26634  ORF Transcript_19478/g.26634 Transcript_19478/m.26634 type:complete len:80 (+) Transcript_19478:3487-3726(+)